jgi:hypothetical protein
MTTLLHGDPVEFGFDRALRLSHLICLARSQAASTSLTENYAAFTEN